MRIVLHITIFFFFISSNILAQSGSKKIIKTYGKDDTITEEFFVQGDNDSIKEGEYKYRYHGKILHEGYYTYGQKDKTWNFYNSDGQLSIKGDYEKGLRHGKWIFYDNNQVIAETFYQEDKKDGVWTFYYPEGKKKRIVNYKNGKRQGETKHFYENGKVSLESNYNDDKLSGEYLKYYDNGKILESSIYKDDKLDGESTVNYQDEKLFMKLEFSAGRLMEVKEQLDPAGNNIKTQSFSNGQGTFISYYLPGDGQNELSVSSSAVFVDGLRNGKYISYHSNGNIKRKGSFFNGCEGKKWKIYNDNGKLADKANFKLVSDKSCDCRNYYNTEQETKKIKSAFSLAFLDKRPQFVGGEEGLMKYLSDNLVYPEKYSIMGIGGQVLLLFMIDELGMVANAKILNSVNEDLDNEALRVVNMMPRWNPGFLDDEAVPVIYQLPINFNTEFLEKK